VAAGGGRKWFGGGGVGLETGGGWGFGVGVVERLGTRVRLLVQRSESLERKKKN